jgi:hypothetical protein
MDTAGKRIKSHTVPMVIPFRTASCTCPATRSGITALARVLVDKVELKSQYELYVKREWAKKKPLFAILKLTSPMLMVKAPTITRSRKSRIRELVTASFLVRTASSIQLCPRTGPWNRPRKFLSGIKDNLLWRTSLCKFATAVGTSNGPRIMAHIGFISTIEHAICMQSSKPFPLYFLSDLLHDKWLTFCPTHWYL